MARRREPGWIGRQLHTDLEPRPVLVTGAMAEDRDAQSDGVTIELRPFVARWARGASRDEFERAAGALVLLHEWLHTDHGTRCTDRRAEEGVAEAVAVDLLPAYLWQRWRQRVPPVFAPHYWQEVRDVRAASAYATGRPASSREARWWREGLRRASCSERQAMLEQATDARDGAR